MNEWAPNHCIVKNIFHFGNRALLRIFLHCKIFYLLFISYHWEFEMMPVMWQYACLVVTSTWKFIFTLHLILSSSCDFWAFQSFMIHGILIIKNFLHFEHIELFELFSGGLGVWRFIASRYAHNPAEDHYEFGYKRGSGHHFTERHEKAHPHSGQFKTHVRMRDLYAPK